MARKARNSKPTQSSSSTDIYSINPSISCLLEVPGLGPYQPNLKCLTVWFVVERVETTLPTSVFKVEVPHGKVARLRGPTSWTYIIVGLLPLWITVTPMARGWILFWKFLRPTGQATTYSSCISRTPCIAQMKLDLHDLGETSKNHPHLGVTNFEPKPFSHLPFNIL